MVRLSIPDVVLFEPQVFADARGHFLESFNRKTFADAVGFDPDFVQDNQSFSHKGVLRGLHYQLQPHAQGKLVRVVAGAAFDVAVDLRDNSPTRLKWVSAMLSAENRNQLWIPPGFAHGFLSLEEPTEFLYKTTTFYDPASERSIRWDDPKIGIDWPTRAPVLSAKDAAAPLIG